jgi:hypothetical protein
MNEKAYIMSMLVKRKNKSMRVKSFVEQAWRALLHGVQNKDLLYTIL